MHRNLDVLYVTSTPLTVALIALFGRVLGLPYVFEVRDLWPEVPRALGELGPRTTRIAHMLADRAYRYAHRIVALSPDIRDGIVARGVAPDRIEVLPNSGAIAGQSAPPPPSEEVERLATFLKGNRTLIYAGTVGRVNRVQYLVDVLAAEPIAGSLEPIHLAVVGDGRELASVKDRVASVGIEDRVHFFRPIPKGHLLNVVLPEALAACSTVDDVPELFGNSANKVFEALALGIPVVINHPGWLAELLVDADCGVSIHPSDPLLAAEELARFLSRVRSDRLGFAQRCEMALRQLGEWNDVAASVGHVLIRAANGA